MDTSRPSARPPLPPFTRETAIAKIRAAEDVWNTCDPELASLACTQHSVWRVRCDFLQGRPAVRAFLARKWNREFEYRVINELWAFTANRIAVRCAYEYYDDLGNWFRACGNENWEFDSRGLMRIRYANINDLPILPNDRLFHWDRKALRPSDHPGLTELAL